MPFEASQISQTNSGGKTVVFNMDTKPVDFAPFLDSTKIGNRQYEDEIYEYYGIQPYWTEADNCSK